MRACVRSEGIHVGNALILLRDTRYVLDVLGWKGISRRCLGGLLDSWLLVV